MNNSNSIAIIFLSRLVIHILKCYTNNSGESRYYEEIKT